MVESVKHHQKIKFKKYGGSFGMMIYPIKNGETRKPSYKKWCLDFLEFSKYAPSQEVLKAPKPSYSKSGWLEHQSKTSGQFVAWTCFFFPAISE